MGLIVHLSLLILAYFLLGCLFDPSLKASHVCVRERKDRRKVHTITLLAVEKKVEEKSFSSGAIFFY